MKQTNRRGFLGVGMAGLASAARLAQAGDEAADSLALGNRTHIFARPEVMEKLTWCFSEVLGCGAPIRLAVPGLSLPMLAFKFPGGGSLSVEFTEEALTDAQMRHGAWVEVRTNDPAAWKKKILGAGLAQVHYPATNTFYFAAPGGQVLGVISASNPAAGEMRVK